MNNHTVSLEITLNVHESMLSLKLVFWTSNWKHVIQYDLYVKFPRIFAHNVQICAKFCCKNFDDVCQVFRIAYYIIILGGVFSWTRCIYRVHIGATWRTRLNRPCAAAMRPYVKLLWPLVIINAELADAFRTKQRWSVPKIMYISSVEDVQSSDLVCWPTL